MKGIAMPIRMIIVIALAVMILVTLGLFFTSESTQQFSRAEANSIFFQGCQTLCTGDVSENIKIADNIVDNEPDFYQACLTLNIEGADRHPTRCLSACNKISCDYTDKTHENNLLRELND